MVAIGYVSQTHSADDEKVLMALNVRYKGLEILEVLVSSQDTFSKRDMLVSIADIVIENPADLLVRNIFNLTME
jgi:hypothetical protein